MDKTGKRTRTLRCCNSSLGTARRTHFCGSYGDCGEGRGVSYTDNCLVPFFLLSPSVGNEKGEVNGLQKIWGKYKKQSVYTWLSVFGCIDHEGYWILASRPSRRMEDRQRDDIEQSCTWSSGRNVIKRILGKVKDFYGKYNYKTLK